MSFVYLHLGVARAVALSPARPNGVRAWSVLVWQQLSPR